MSVYIKVRKDGEKSWKFLGSEGRMNRLRIHAVSFPSREAAQKFIDAAGPNNTGYSWKIVI